MTDLFRPDLLADQHVLVTGGGTGLGRAMAERFAGLGAAVTINGRRRAPLEETVAAIVAAGGRATGIPCDVRKPERVQACVDEAEQRQGPLTALVNNAAGNFLALSEELEPKGFDAIVSINLYGTFHTTQAVAQRWIERGSGGAVVSIVATYAETGSAYVLPSAASKAAIVALSRSLAAEWGRHGIRLNCIAPGPIPTPGAWKRLVPDEDAERRWRERAPLGRFATREELADLATFLLSPGSAMMTGQVVDLDGGGKLRGGSSFTELTTLPLDEVRAMFDEMRPRKSREKPPE